MMEAVCEVWVSYGNKVWKWNSFRFASSDFKCNFSNFNILLKSHILIFFGENNILLHLKIIVADLSTMFLRFVKARKLTRILHGPIFFTKNSENCRLYPIKCQTTAVRSLSFVCGNLTTDEHFHWTEEISSVRCVLQRSLQLVGWYRPPLGYFRWSEKLVNAAWCHPRALIRSLRYLVYIK